MQSTNAYELCAEYEDCYFTDQDACTILLSPFESISRFLQNCVWTLSLEDTSTSCPHFISYISNRKMAEVRMCEVR
jgi:hypothetical protein